MTILLGCIADDFTGATDLANTLVRQGMRTVQYFSPPDNDVVVPEADAIVIALKSRTNPVEEAITQSLDALQWLQKAGAAQFFFKYCSTF
ncbi:MAG: four-carbon acid sugar kinase family protein, partial [Rhodospirillaceae bacterium]|nr:four-carbon acid sugar kinase family protein [Rhodospirillaceae bacterium]